jgi:thioredoxin-related protein
MSQKILFSLMLFIMLLLLSCKKEMQETNPNLEVTAVLTSEAPIQLIQFHSEHRCMTCNKIESLAIESLQNLEGVPFQLVNVDAKENAAFAEEFEATGTALYLYNKQTGAKKDLTEFAFMNAGNPMVFLETLIQEVETFKAQ